MAMAILYCKICQAEGREAELMSQVENLQSEVERPYTEKVGGHGAARK